MSNMKAITILFTPAIRPGRYIYNLLQGLFNFCKYNFKNIKLKSEEGAIGKSPAAILMTAGNDCKHYSLFVNIGGVIGAIKFNENEPWSWCYRFASDQNNGDIGHVFVSCEKRRVREIWIDPVFNNV